MRTARERATEPRRRRARRVRTTAPAVAGAIVALVAVPLGFAGPVSAEQLPFIVHYADHDEQLLGGDDCVPFPVRFTHDGWGTFRLLLHGDSRYYGAGTFNDTNVWTNLDNGKSFTLTAHGVDKDLHVTDDGAGVLTIAALESGSFSYRGPDGTLLLHDAGTFTSTVVIDTKGTPAPEDDVELSHTPTGSRGLNQTADRDLCADLTRFIG